MLSWMLALASSTEVSPSVDSSTRNGYVFVRVGQVSCGKTSELGLPVVVELGENRPWSRANIRQIVRPPTQGLLFRLADSKKWNQLLSLRIRCLDTDMSSWRRKCATKFFRPSWLAPGARSTAYISIGNFPTPCNNTVSHFSQLSVVVVWIVGFATVCVSVGILVVLVNWFLLLTVGVGILPAETLVSMERRWTEKMTSRARREKEYAERKRK